jgi:hypothetical protein
VIFIFYLHRLATAVTSNAVYLGLPEGELPSAGAAHNPMSLSQMAIELGLNLGRMLSLQHSSLTSAVPNVEVTDEVILLRHAD